MERNTIGGFIAALRKSHGMTQQELADRLCVSNKTVSKWERGESYPELTLVPVIAEIFGVTSDEILRGERVPRAAEAAKGAPHTEEQAKRLLQSSVLRYKTASLIAAALMLTGFVALLVLTLAAYLPEVGFGVMAVFLIAGLALQIVSVARADAALCGEGVDARLLTAGLQSLVRYAFHVFWLGAAVLLLSLSTIIEVQVIWPDTFVIMSALDYYLYETRPLAACAVVLYWAAKWAVSRALKRRQKLAGVALFSGNQRVTIWGAAISAAGAILLLV